MYTNELNIKYTQQALQSSASSTIDVENGVLFIYGINSQTIFIGCIQRLNCVTKMSLLKLISQISKYLASECKESFLRHFLDNYFIHDD